MYILTEEEYGEINRKLDQILTIMKGNYIEKDEMIKSDEMCKVLKISLRTLSVYRERRIIP